MKIYVVTKSYDYEGPEILEIFFKLVNARELVCKQIELFDVSDVKKFTGLVGGRQFESVKIEDCSIVITEWEL